jgi:hypothetical protein
MTEQEPRTPASKVQRLDPGSKLQMTDGIHNLTVRKDNETLNIWTAPFLPDHGSSQISKSERYTVKNSTEKEKRNARKIIQSRIQTHGSGYSPTRWWIIRTSLLLA